MDLTQIPLFRTISRRLGFLEERQRVLAENVANVDTPGFQPRDVKSPNFAKLADVALKQLKTAATDPHHIIQDANAHRDEQPEQAGKYEVTVSGNGVNLEDQLLKISKTNFDHQTMIDLYRKQVGLLKIALDRGG